MDKAKGKDHTKVCWSCGENTIQPEGSFYRCSECGATFVPLNAPRPPALTYSHPDTHKNIASKPYGVPW